MINGANEYVDQVKEQFGGTATIFLGDVRVATNVRQADGSRAIGTRLAAGPAYDDALAKGKIYRGEAEIFGASYITLYEPILVGADVVGILYVGVPKATAPSRGKADPARLANEMMPIAAASRDIARSDGRQGQGRARRPRTALYRGRRRPARGRHDPVVRGGPAAGRRRAVPGARKPRGHESHASDRDRIPEEYRNLKTNFMTAATILRDTMRTIGAQADAITAFPEGCRTGRRGFVPANRTPGGDAGGDRGLA